MSEDWQLKALPHPLLWMRWLKALMHTAHTHTASPWCALYSAVHAEQRAAAEGLLEGATLVDAVRW